MVEQIILGLVQGVAEWLPVSSEGMLVLISKNFFHNQAETSELIRQALFLHLGTFLAALIYFRKDVWKIIKTFINYRSSESEDKKLAEFLAIVTVLSGILGFVFYRLSMEISSSLAFSAKIVNVVIGFLLIITAVLQIRYRSGGHKKTSQVDKKDGFFLGLGQALAVLPGLSRSGLTVSFLLLKKYDDEAALRLSFLMSLPIVFFGNIVLNFRDILLLKASFWALLFSFVFGWLTIDLLLRVARKVNFGYFVLVFALLVMASVFI